jgi:hypothetical protein
MNLLNILFYAFMTFVVIQAISEIAAMKAEARIIDDFIKFFNNLENESIEQIKKED